jgi:hypothetical protein
VSRGHPLALNDVWRYDGAVQWRYWLIELPAAIMDAWFRFYWFLLTVVTVAMVAVVLIGAVMDLLGIRWGW